MKTGLILEGGAMRGMFTAGVLDVMMEEGIDVDGVIGVSAGAVFGCNYKSRQIGRTLRYNKKYCTDPRYASVRSLLKTGDMFGAEFCYHELPNKLDVFDVETFEKNPVEFYTVCTNLETGRAIYHKCSDGKERDCLWMRASASMPLASRVVEIDDYKLLDGGIADSIPIRYFEHIGYEKNVVVLTQPKDYIKKKNKMVPLIHLALFQYPKLVKAMKRRHIMYNQTISYIRQREKEGAVFVIQPPKSLEIGHVSHDPEELQRVYDIGRAQAKEQLEALRKFLAV
ncbi:MAG: patatin family protein [Lachnospiraceae bacterium]